MLEFIILFLVVAVFGKLFLFGLKAAWGLARLLLTVIFLPAIILGLFAAGLLYIAVPLLLIAGVGALIASA